MTVLIGRNYKNRKYGSAVVRWLHAQTNNEEFSLQVNGFYLEKN